MLKQRIITAVILMVGLIAATTMLSPFQFSIFTSVVVLLAAWEWCGLIGLTATRSKLGFLATIASMLLGLYVLLGVSPSAVQLDQLRASLILVLGVVFWLFSLSMLKGYPANKDDWNDQSRIAALGLFALIPVWVSIVQLKYLMPAGYLVLALVIAVAAVDVGAYFVGTLFGKRKLAPKLSPKKSWEGVWGGLLVCVLIVLAMCWALNRYLMALQGWQLAVLLILPVGVTFFSVIGDLLESMLKRNKGMKDSGKILPGHGGILDRVDGLLAAAPSFTLVLMLVWTSVE